MAEDTKPKETTATPEEAKPVVLMSYLLKSAARGRTNRTARVSVPGRMPFVQRIAGGTILVRRARPARISEAALKANLKEIQGLVDRHQLEVTTLDGRAVNLKTFEAGPLATAEKPLPNPPLDSAKNDKNKNVGYDVPPTPEGTTMNAPEPELLKKGPQFDEEPPTQPLLPSQPPEAPPPVATAQTSEPPAPPPPARTHDESRPKGGKGKGR